MKRIAIAVVLLLSSVASSGAQGVAVQGADILDYGIYATDPTQTRYDEQGVAHAVGDDHAKHAVTTTTVPLQHRATFGFDYRLTGSPSGTPVKVKYIVVFPPGGLHPPGKPPVLQGSDDDTVRIGNTAHFTWEFDDPWELVPGTWTLQVWYGDRKLAEKSFTVIAQ